MMFRIVFWDVLQCKIIVDRRFRGAKTVLNKTTIHVCGDFGSNYFAMNLTSFSVLTDPSDLIKNKIVIIRLSTHTSDISVR
jgi:hypothetical protein